MRMSDWSSDVCSSDLRVLRVVRTGARTVIGFEAAFIVVGDADVAQIRLLPRAGQQDVPAVAGPPAEQGARALLIGAVDVLLVGVQVVDIAGRKSLRLNPVTNAHHVCRLLL